MADCLPEDRTRQCRPAALATLFGSFRLNAADGADIAITNRRARALLGMLCLAKAGPIERDQLSRMLWPGRFEAHAKASLRQCLVDLGKLLAPLAANILDVKRTSIALHPGVIHTDLDAVEDALARGDHAVAAARLESIGAMPLLDQMDFGQAFNQWLDRCRGDAEKRLGGVIGEALAALERTGDHETRARLHAAWSARRSGVRPVAASAPPPGRTRIAVLPFQPVGAHEDHRYFADGIVDELITALGQVPQLLVAGRTSSFHFRDSGDALPVIAEALGVLYLIEGSVQRQGEQVRIHVHLVDGSGGFERWGQRFDGTLDTIFALQERVAQAVTAAIAGVLDIAMQPPLVHSLTHSKAAYDLYLQGRALSFRLFGDGALETAIGLLDRAVALDPQFAEAWLLLGEVHQLVAIYTACLDRPAASARMAACVERALAIKPGLGQAYALLGLHQMIRNDFLGALDLTFKGYRLEPNNPAIAMRLGSYLLFCGRTQDGMRYIEEAISQDPIDGRKFMLRCSAHLNRGNIAAAIEDGQRAVDLGFASMWLAVATMAAGQHDRAVDQYMQTRQLVNKTIFPPAGTTPMPPEVMDAYWLVAARGVCSGKAEDRDAYCRVLDHLRGTMHDRADGSIALPAVFMGYADLLFETLGEAITPGNMGCLMSIWTPLDPMCRIWQHPEFIPFAQRVGMAAAWDKYGWPDLLPPPSNRA